MRTAIALAAAILALAASPGAAQRFSMGQSFAVPSSHTFLSVVHTGQLSGDGGVDFVFSLHAFDGATYSGPALFSTAPSSAFAANQTLDVGLALTPGSTYVFLLHQSTPAHLSSMSMSTVSHEWGDRVPGGEALDCWDTRCSGMYFPGDIQNFALTFTAGEISTVPEPGTWALLGTGLLALGGIAMRRPRGAV